eukprot:TRINITY_DN912_c0_g3_i1.p1 TRINITY_DN912_c0_g3~~TRINITY_DN912_c0_g3_i1.p1  ORF type:complete len:491 (-),score=55.57 TRINITY_DN912_c0_g3_i1:2717-4189(-)
MGFSWLPPSVHVLQLQRKTSCNEDSFPSFQSPMLEIANPLAFAARCTAHELGFRNAHSEAHTPCVITLVMSRPINPRGPSPPRPPPAPPAPSPPPLHLPHLQPLVSSAAAKTSSNALLPRKRSYAHAGWSSATEAAPSSQPFSRAPLPESEQGAQTGAFDNGLPRDNDLLRADVTVPVCTSPPPPLPFNSSSHDALQTHTRAAQQRRVAFHDEKALFGPARRRTASPDSFVQAAEMGARAQSVLDSAHGRVFDTYHLGQRIISCCKLYANQRRSNRLLPGGSDSTTAACYMIGGTCDQTLQSLLERLSPCDPREERCKAVERVLKDKTRGAICALNGENPREARADNLAAVRICETVADILVAYLCRKLIQQHDELSEKVSSLENDVGSLRNELVIERRRREVTERDCWCKGSAEKNQPSAVLSTIANQSVTNVVPTHTMDMHSFERNKLLVGRGNLSSSGFRSEASVGHSLADAVEKETQHEVGKFPSH